MSAIGGILYLKNEGIDFNVLNKMHRSLALRGRKYSDAFVFNNIGIFYNESDVSEKTNNRQPFIFTRQGYTHALCMDSNGLNVRAAGEKYLFEGIDFLGTLKGAFSLALYDSQRQILLLARDKQGRKPLFYRIYNNKIYFSSEVKGILDGTEVPAIVDCRSLWGHIISPAGIFRAVNMYPDICEVLPGECVIFTKTDMCKFFYRERNDVKAIKPTIKKPYREKIISPYQSFKTDKLQEYLSNALIAFDYPQFDVFMPPVMELLENLYSTEVHSVFFFDETRRKNICYAREREDRLGSFYSINVAGVQTKTVANIDYDCLDKTEKILCKMLTSMNERKMCMLKEAFGEYKPERLIKMLDRKSSEDTERNIRSLGMLYQTADWLESREFKLDNRCDDFYYSALSII